MVVSPVKVFTPVNVSVDKVPVSLTKTVLLAWPPLITPLNVWSSVELYFSWA